MELARFRTNNVHPTECVQCMSAHLKHCLVRVCNCNSQRSLPFHFTLCGMTKRRPVFRTLQSDKSALTVSIKPNQPASVSPNSTATANILNESKQTLRRRIADEKPCKILSICQCCSSTLHRSSLLLCQNLTWSITSVDPSLAN